MNRIALSLCLLAAFAGTSAAQPGEPRTVTVAFRSGNDASGYDVASMELRYRFYNCIGDIHLGYVLVKGTVRASSRYWFEGKLVTSSVPAPEPSTIHFAGRVWFGNAAVGVFRDDVAGSYGGAGCLGQSQKVFPKPEHLKTNAEIDSYLNSLRITVDAAPPLRNSAIETEVLTERRRQREDSLARVAAARRDSLRLTSEKAQARRDSLNRVAQQQRDSIRAANIRRADSLAVAAKARRDSLQQLARTRADSLALRAQARQDSIAMAREDERREEEEKENAAAALAAEKEALDPEAAAVKRQEKEDEEMARIRYEMQRNQALTVEAEGDRYHQMGLMWREYALQKYREAQGIMPNERVQQKVANIEAELAAIQAAREMGAMLGEGIDALEAKIQASGMRRYSGGFLTYEALSGGMPKGLSADAQSPRSFFLGVGRYRVFAAEFRGGYVESLGLGHPVLRGRTDELFNEQPNGDTVYLSHKGPAIGLSLGFGLPMGLFAPYATIGFNGVLSIPNPYMASERYKVEQKILSGRLTKVVTLGLNLRLPRGKGLGFYYNQNEDYGAERKVEISRPDDSDTMNEYFVGARKGKGGAAYKTYGIRFFWNVPER